MSNMRPSRRQSFTGKLGRLALDERADMPPQTRSMAAAAAARHTRSPLPPSVASASSASRGRRSASHAVRQSIESTSNLHRESYEGLDGSNDGSDGSDDDDDDDRPSHRAGISAGDQGYDGPRTVWDFHALLDPSYLTPRELADRNLLQIHRNLQPWTIEFVILAQARGRELENPNLVRALAHFIPIPRPGDVMVDKMTYRLRSIFAQYQSHLESPSTGTDSQDTIRGLAELFRGMVHLMQIYPSRRASFIGIILDSLESILSLDRNQHPISSRPRYVINDDASLYLQFLAHWDRFRAWLQELQELRPHRHANQIAELARRYAARAAALEESRQQGSNGRELLQRAREVETVLGRMARQATAG